MMKLKSKKIILPIILALLLAFLLYNFYFANQKEYIGVVEASLVTHTSEVSGKVISMPVELGEHVKKGDLIASIDSSDLKYNQKQLELALEKKKLSLSELDSTSSNTQAENSLSIAEANYNSALSANQKAASDYKNALALYEQGAVSKDFLENSKVKANTALSALETSKAQLDSAKNNYSSESMALEVAQSETQLAQLKDTIAKYQITALTDGIIMSKSYIVGDMVAPGYQIVDISDDSEKYFVFYLPVEYLDIINYEQKIMVKTKSASYEALVKYIDVKSEYTPKDMQTTANKNRQSVKVKLLLPADCPLKPGQEASVNLSTNS